MQPARICNRRPAPNGLSLFARSLARSPRSPERDDVGDKRRQQVEDKRARRRLLDQPKKPRAQPARRAKGCASCGREIRRARLPPKGNNKWERNKKRDKKRQRHDKYCLLVAKNHNHRRSSWAPLEELVRERFARQRQRELLLIELKTALKEQPLLFPPLNARLFPHSEAKRLGQIGAATLVERATSSFRVALRKLARARAALLRPNPKRPGSWAPTVSIVPAREGRRAGGWKDPKVAWAGREVQFL